nr:cytochrome c peroxidase [Sedimenticola hydrogenitrophicus]
MGLLAVATGCEVESVESATNAAVGDRPADTSAGSGSVPPTADLEAGATLITQNDCVACHKLETKLVGPAYRDIANRYGDDPDAPAILVDKIRLGGAGSWGEIPMAPHPTLTNDQIGNMVAWILAQKTNGAEATAPVEVILPEMGAIAYADPARIPAYRESEHVGEPLAPLPETPAIDTARAELGRQLFFDTRLSGDATVSCATCHVPDQGFGDGQPLAPGYPGSLYFRNSPTLINATLQARFMWDGRLDGSDPATLVRDMITEAHTMNVDSRMMQERLKQVPEYLAQWQEIFGDASPYGPRVYAVVGEFLKTIRSRNVPFDRYVAGETGVLSESARRGLELFQGKANCIQCHNGALLSDAGLHVTGVPEHPEILKSPLRSITMLRHFSTFGVPNYMAYRRDIGYYVVTKEKADLGKFRTAPLRDLKYTAPYMHNGVFETLAEVIDFYNAGGGDVPNKDSLLKPLGLTAAEKNDLLAFLQALSGDSVTVTRPERLPEYQVREFGRN